jgi:hypothetical protein
MIPCSSSKRVPSKSAPVSLDNIFIQHMDPNNLPIYLIKATTSRCMSRDVLLGIATRLGAQGPRNWGSFPSSCCKRVLRVQVDSGAHSNSISVDTGPYFAGF